ncbi:MAG: hypothetical protein V4843_05820, partial [Pseudomonadota bacterium]
VGEAERDAGRSGEALAAYSEGLELRRQLRQALGDSPQVLDDLAVSLMQIAASPLLTVPERNAALDEAVCLLERLAASAPQNITYAQRLNTARQMAQNSNLNPAA